VKSSSRMSRWPRKGKDTYLREELKRGEKRVHSAQDVNEKDMRYVPGTMNIERKKKPKQTTHAEILTRESGIYLRKRKVDEKSERKLLPLPPQVPLTLNFPPPFNRLGPLLLLRFQLLIPRSNPNFPHFAERSSSQSSFLSHSAASVQSEFPSLCERSSSRSSLLSHSASSVQSEFPSLCERSFSWSAPITNTTYSLSHSFPRVRTLFGSASATQGILGCVLRNVSFRCCAMFLSLY
jgi:hypothetical protein